MKARLTEQMSGIVRYSRAGDSEFGEVIDTRNGDNAACAILMGVTVLLVVGVCTAPHAKALRRRFNSGRMSLGGG